MQQPSTIDSDIINDLNHTLLFENLFHDHPTPPYMQNEQPVIVSNEHDHLALPQDFNQERDNNIVLRRSSRSRKPPSYLQEFHCNIAAAAENNPICSNALYPLSNYIDYSNLSDSHRQYALTISTLQEPATYKQAIKSKEWIDAMQAELHALDLNDTWDIVTLPPGKKSIGCKWVYKIKLKSDGSLERYKARLVARGFTQTEGIDYFDTFSPVAKVTTIILLLALSTVNNWHLQQLDVQNTFLHGQLDEEVYMDLPPGLPTTQPNQVCRLKKSLYGLKQSSRQWFAKLSQSLISQGYTQSNSDYSLFIKHAQNSFTALLVYVDDFTHAGNDVEEINNVKAFLHHQFRIRDLGNLKYFLGLEIVRSHKGLHIC